MRTRPVGSEAHGTLVFKNKSSKLASLRDVKQVSPKIHPTGHFSPLTRLVWHAIVCLSLSSLPFIRDFRAIVHPTNR